MPTPIIRTTLRMPPRAVCRRHVACGQRGFAGLGEFGEFGEFGGLARECDAARPASARGASVRATPCAQTGRSMDIDRHGPASPKCGAATRRTGAGNLHIGSTRRSATSVRRSPRRNAISVMRSSHRSATRVCRCSTLVGCGA
ncbi:hypothetical protein WK29_20955 [Burkholderia vietnamiensis]|nr:hypothetical protein WK29_20955 [Burkholderia vietnamiensis]